MGEPYFVIRKITANEYRYVGEFDAQDYGDACQQASELEGTGRYGAVPWQFMQFFDMTTEPMFPQPHLETTAQQFVEQAEERLSTEPEDLLDMSPEQIEQNRHLVEHEYGVAGEGGSGLTVSDTLRVEDDETPDAWEVEVDDTSDSAIDLEVSRLLNS